jgi:hypothetical protein
MKFLQELSVLSRKERRQTEASRLYKYNIVLPGETFGEQDDLYAGIVVFDRVGVHKHHGAETQFAKLGCKYIAIYALSYFVVYVNSWKLK